VPTKVTCAAHAEKGVILVLCAGELKLRQTPSPPQPENSPHRAYAGIRSDPPTGKALATPPGGLAWEILLNFALKEVLMKPERILLQVALLMGGLAAQNVGIGISTPTERLHVAGNLRLDNAFMPGNQPGAVGNILVSQGANVAPVWLPNGPAGSILTSAGPGNDPVWTPNPICGSPNQNRFTKFTSTSPTQVCNTTLAENTNDNIWNADGAAAPLYGVDKFEIIATTARPYAINGYATTGYGVYGEASSTFGNGVVGLATGANGIGVYGYTDQATSTGVTGVNADPNGIAGYFFNSAGAGTGTGHGVVGRTSQGVGFGVMGINDNTQTGTYPAGVVGAGGTTTTLRPAFADGTGGSFTGEGVGVAGWKLGNATDGEGGGVFAGDLVGGLPTLYAYVAWRTGGTNYKINGTGSVGTIVDGLNGRQDRRIMVAPEMPEIHFMDVGQGQLQGGRAYIQLDPIFAKNIVVNEQHPLRVLIQLEDECNGVRVTNKSQYGFEVIELNGGTSNARFTYFVIANRADEKDEYGNVISKHEGVRFPPAPGPPPAIARSIDEVKIKVREPKGLKETH
jgi:hypothetical protein